MPSGTSSLLTRDPDASLSVPVGWRVGRSSHRTAVFAYGSHIELEINPRYYTPRARHNNDPSVYHVRVRKRRHNREITGNATVLGRAETFDDAIGLATDYMAEFVRDRHETAMETRAELEADPVMADEAEEAIVTEAAASATIEVAGYSDDFLLDELHGILEPDEASVAPVVQAVIHREEGDYDVVYIADAVEHLGDPDRLREFGRQFEWLNDQKLANEINAGELTAMMARFEDTRLLRYLASEDEETLILLDPEFPLHVPPFERQIAEIINAKWA